MSSLHQAVVVPIKLEKHPNADKLSIIKIDDYTYVGNTEEWIGIEKAFWIPPENIVDVSRPEFAWLAPEAKDGKYRVKAKKLRGIVSYGVMAKGAEPYEIGWDATEFLGIIPWQPEESGVSGPTCGGQIAPAPSIPLPGKYDIENILKYGRKVFVEGEPVFVSAKIEGCNGFYIFHETMHCKSREQFKKEFDEARVLTVEDLVSKGKTEEEALKIIENMKNRSQKRNLWWDVLNRTPAIEEFCRANPGIGLFGEVYGQVKGFTYGVEPGKPKFACFDIWNKGQFVCPQEFYDLTQKYKLEVAPIYNEVIDGKIQGIPYNLEKMREMAEGVCLLDPKVINEGIVVRPMAERYEYSIGRVQLKYKSSVYLEKKK